MKNTLIAVIVIILLVLGLWWGMHKNEAQAPANDELGQIDNETDGNMEDMQPAPVPSDYNTPVATTPNTPVKEFTVEGKNFSFSPSTIKVKKGDLVKITFKNVGGFHDFVIDEFKVRTKQIRTDETDTVSFLADKTGSFEYYCSVGTHRELGMRGTLTVE